MQRISIILVLPFLFCFSACSGNNPQGRVAIRGDIMLDGQPLLEGSIQFESLPEMQPGVITGGTIEKGTFSIAAADGLIPEQEYIVRIRSMEEIPGTSGTASSMSSMTRNIQYRDIIPPQYGKASTVTFKATKKSPNVFQIDIKPE